MGVPYFGIAREVQPALATILQTVLHGLHGVKSKGSTAKMDLSLKLGQVYYKIYPPQHKTAK